VGVGQDASSKFWKRRSEECLPQLHKGGCWLSKKDNVKIGSLAILKEDNTPSLKWKIVRITKVHPGGDGIVRVVTITNSTGREFQRPTSKIAVLPSIKEEKDAALPVFSLHSKCIIVKASHCFLCFYYYLVVLVSVQCSIFYVQCISPTLKDLSPFKGRGENVGANMAISLCLVFLDRCNARFLVIFFFIIFFVLTNFFYFP